MKGPTILSGLGGQHSAYKTEGTPTSQSATAATTSVLVPCIHFRSSYLTRPLIFTMQFITMITMMIGFIISAVDTTVAKSVSVSYDTLYDNPNVNLNAVACSNGNHGLLNKGFTTFGSLPHFPNISGSSVVTGWNSPNCGSCWQLSWSHTGATIHVLVVDSNADGFTLSQTAMGELTDNQELSLGKISGVSATEVSASACGL